MVDTLTPVLVNLRTLGLCRTPGRNNGGEWHAGRTLLSRFEPEMQSSESKCLVVKEARRELDCIVDTNRSDLYLG